MPLAAGTRIGIYEILAPLGAGGMGEVYRARDTRLRRDVAIKILPEAFARDPDRLMRFDREARSLAALNHPHIAQVYGVEEAVDVSGSGAAITHALVMELVTGEDLSERLRRGPLPIDEALSIAVQVASALEAAHDQGIIHRDLKPANIKLRDDGTTKVLDFGLAKPTHSGSSIGDALPDGLAAPTVTSPAMTMRGVILGTAAYMAPEQAKGQAVDPRADVWAFGCVLYEMLTGRRAFGGHDVTEVLAGVIKTDPDWSHLPPTTPPSVRTLLKRSVMKDRSRRVQHMGDARMQIEDALAEPTLGVTAARDGATRRYGWVWPATAVAAALAAVVLGLRPGPSESGPTQVRFLVYPERGSSFSFTSGAAAAIPEIALSPDGKWLAFAARGPGPEGRRLWLRQLDALEAHALPGTEGATQPFWAPDTSTVAFFSQGKLKHVSPNGGPVQVLCCEKDLLVGIGGGGAWGPGGEILVGGAGIRRIRQGATSSLETVLAAPDRVEYRFPSFLSEGGRFLFTAAAPSPFDPRSNDVAGIYVGALDGTEPRRIAPDASQAVFGVGRVLYVRNRVLVSQAFDDATSTLTGEARPIAGDFYTSNFGAGAFSASRRGVLAYSPGEADLVQFLWVNRDGQSREAIGEPGPFLFVQLSPQGDRVAFDRYDQERQTRDVWVMQSRTGELSRLTFDEADDANPVWSPNGQSVYFVSARSPRGMYEKSLEGSVPESLVADVPGGWPRSVSSDGRFLVFVSQSPPWDLLAVRLGSRNQPPMPVVTSKGNDSDGQLAPVAPLLAYSSDESGRLDVYVQRFPSAGQRWQVSLRGGSQPRWRRDGRELYYVAPDGMLMAVPVQPGDVFQRGAAVPLFPLSTIGAGRSSYAPSPDGQRFFIAEPVPPRLGIAVIVDGSDQR